MINMNNKRAEYAFKNIAKIRNCPPKIQSEFRTLARSLPTMVQSNGLTAAVAYLYSKKSNNNAHNLMYIIMHNWLIDRKDILKDDKIELMYSISKMDSPSLRITTAEVMALLVWIKRFAEGMFDSNEQ